MRVEGEWLRMVGYRLRSRGVGDLRRGQQSGGTGDACTFTGKGWAVGRGAKKGRGSLAQSCGEEHTETHARTQAGRQTGRQTDRQTDRQAGRQAQTPDVHVRLSGRSGSA